VTSGGGGNTQQQQQQQQQILDGTELMTNSAVNFSHIFHPGRIFASVQEWAISVSL